MTALHPATAEWQPLAGDPRTVEVASEQLYGRACMVCGNQHDGLVDAGHVFTETAGGDRLPWPVKACSDHTGKEAAA